MTGAYKLNDVAYMIESNHYIREGKIIHISGDLITFKFLDCMGAATKIKAHRLYPTEEAVFTDMEGNAYTYRMTAQEILPGTDPEAMEKGEWDLTLFTCTLGGKNRVTIRFARTE